MIKASCPICGQELRGQSLAEWPEFPFCGKRCKTIDLGRWLTGAYGIPEEEPEDATSSGETALR